MKITDLNIIAELQRLAEACPWDNVELTVHRNPPGTHSFIAYIASNPDIGAESVWSYGASPKDVVDDAIARSRNRDPEILRKQKITELRDKLAKLEAVVIGLPPYRPNRELAEINAPVTVDV